MMQIVCTLLLSSYLFLSIADEFDDEEETHISLQGFAGLNSHFFTNTPADKHSNSVTTVQQLQLRYEADQFSLNATLYAQEAYYDTLEGSEQTGRTFTRLDELFLQYDLENSSLKMGKSLEFWGALEVYNATDVFNSIDFRNETTDTNNKLGSWNINYSYYTENGELSFIVKLYEESESMAKYPYFYYFLPKNREETIQDKNVTFNFRYDKELHSQQSVGKPSIYLKYSASTDFALDYAVVLERGYDSQRYIDITLPTTTDSDIVFNSVIYQVNKLLTFNTLAIEDTLYKFEGTYTNIVDDANVSDYVQLSVGVEHTLIGFLEFEGDLGLLAEYYYYETLESSQGKYTDLTLFQTFQNDLFLGVRYTFNDATDSTFIGGVIVDTEYSEQLYTAEYERRILSDIKLQLSYQYIKPSTLANTAYSLIGRHQKIAFDMSYYF